MPDKAWRQLSSNPQFSPASFWVTFSQSSIFLNSNHTVRTGILSIPQLHLLNEWLEDTHPTIWTGISATIASWVLSPSLTAVSSHHSLEKRLVSQRLWFSDRVEPWHLSSEPSLEGRHGRGEARYKAALQVGSWVHFSPVWPIPTGRDCSRVSCNRHLSQLTTTSALSPSYGLSPEENMLLTLSLLSLVHSPLFYRSNWFLSFANVSESLLYPVVSFKLFCVIYF